MLIADDLDNLLNILPDFIKKPLNIHSSKKSLIEIVMDLGRRPEARFPNGPEYLSDTNISWNDLDFCIKKIPQFSGDNRSGIECTLHRISSIKNRKGNVVGLTFRVGRAIFGTISHVRDILYTEESILLLGKPGVGKTTAIREITRVLADEMQKRVVIIDTSNEIAGDGDIPHPAIGRARRMQVARPELQHQVMIEAVENHMPEVIIIDEIGTELEALAARTIAERGVQLVGTAHGNCLNSLVKNPILCDLVGGIQYVTLGDDEAKRRGSQKSVVERKSVPAFQIAVEIHDTNSCIVHEKVDQVVDKILQGSPFPIQRRKLDLNGKIYIESKSSDSIDFMMYNSNFYLKNNNTFQNRYNSVKSYNKASIFANLVHQYTNRLHFLHDYPLLMLINRLYGLMKLYVYGINIEQVELAIRNLNLFIIVTRDIIGSDYILGCRSLIQRNFKIRQLAKIRKMIIYTITDNKSSSIIKALNYIYKRYQLSIYDWYKLCLGKNSAEVSALIETREAIEKVTFAYRESVELLSQSDRIISLQLNLINFYGLSYSIFGDVGSQKLLIYPQ